RTASSLPVSASHSRADRSAAAKMILPSRLKHATNPPASRASFCCPVSASHSRTPVPPVRAVLPSGLKHTLTTGPKWPSSLASSRHVWASHRRAASPPVTRRLLSGLKHAHLMLPGWPLTASLITRLVSTFHSPPTQLLLMKTRLPSGLIARTLPSPGRLPPG